jgi:hypothetical protein
VHGAAGGDFLRLVVVLRLDLGISRPRGLFVAGQTSAVGAGESLGRRERETLPLGIVAVGRVAGRAKVVLG